MPISRAWQAVIRRAYKQGLGTLHLMPCEEVRRFLPDNTQDTLPPHKTLSLNAHVSLLCFEPRGKAISNQAVLTLGASGYVWHPISRNYYWASMLAERLCCRVYLLKHRLAPEHKFPAAFEDTILASRYLKQHYDNLAICGESAGGTLVAAACHYFRDAGEEVFRHQVLIYPFVAGIRLTASILCYGKGHLCDQALLDWMETHYTHGWHQRFLDGHAPPVDYRLAPYWHPNMKGLPLATVITGSYDLLRDEIFLYARKLEKAKRLHHLACYPGVGHCFATYLEKIPQAEQAMDLIVDSLTQALSPA